MNNEKQKKRLDIHKIVQDNRNKAFRLLRKAAQGEIEMTTQQIQANESLLRLAMTFSEDSLKKCQCP